jgi:hypothetical protein
LQNLEHYPEALAAVAEAQRLGAAGAFPHIVTAQLQLQLGHLEAARREFELAADLRAEPGPWLGLALVARLQDRAGDEIAALEHAIDLDLGFGPPAVLLEQLAAARQRVARQQALKGFGTGLAAPN